MKKIFRFLPGVIIVMAFFACSNTKNAASTIPRQDFKGTWVVSSASVEGTDTKNLNVHAFDDVELRCFEGSEWVFPNNGYGSYTINQQDCSSGTRQILWSQRVRDGVTLLNFKKMDGVKKNQSKDVAEGYSLEVTSFDQNHFVAKSPIQFEGSTIYIVYNFDKR